jgi:hypothetical protein
MKGERGGIPVEQTTSIDKVEMSVRNEYIYDPL